MGIQETPQWPLMSIREVAARSGVPASTLRFYETRAIKSHRNGSSHRHYSRAVLRLIAFIVFAQKIGYSLDEIAEQLVSLPRTPRRATRTGSGCRAAGSSASRAGSRSCSACTSTSTNASAAAACR